MKIRDHLLSFRCSASGITYSSLTPSQREAKSKVLALYKDLPRFKHRDCPLCYSADGTFTCIAKQDILGLPCETLVCPNCGFIFQDNHLGDEALNLNYAHFSLLLRGKEIHNVQKMNELFWSRINRFVLPRVKFVQNKINFTAEDLVIEIGCNDGANLYPYHQMGLRTVGFDYDENALKVGRAHGLNLVCSDPFDYFEKEAGTIKLIILSHFLEHVSRPREFLEKLKNIMSDETIVFIEVPGYKEGTWLSAKMGVIPYLNYEHLLSFEKETLDNLAKVCGFKIIESDQYIKALWKKDSELAKCEVKPIQSLDYMARMEKKYLFSPWHLRDKLKMLISTLKNSNSKRLL